MNRLTLEQRWDLLEIYFQNKDNWSEIARKCRTKFGRREGPTVPGIRKFIAKVRETGFIVDAPKCERARTVLTPENIKAVAECVRENPLKSTRRRSQELNISRTSLRRILQNNVKIDEYLEKQGIRSMQDYGLKKSVPKRKKIVNKKRQFQRPRDNEYLADVLEIYEDNTLTQKGVNPS